MRWRSSNESLHLSRCAPIAVLVVMVLGFSLSNPRFLTLTNLLSILRQASVLWVVGAGLTFVILTGAIDLSVEGVMALTGVICGLLLPKLGLFTILAGLLIGMILGIANGLIYVGLRIPSFMGTLGLNFAFSGLAVMLSRGYPIPVSNPAYRSLSLGTIYGFPAIACISLFICLLAAFIERRTITGRHIFAVGGAESLARQLGVSIDRVKLAAFALAGLFYGAAAVLNVARLGTASIEVGVNYLFPALTAIAIGGTSLGGGIGGARRTLLGVAIVTVLSNGMIINGIDPYIQGGIQGAIIIGAVALTINRRELETVK